MIDIHQNRSNTPFLTPFDHIHFRPALAEKCIPDLRVRLMLLLTRYHPIHPYQYHPIHAIKQLITIHQIRQIYIIYPIRPIQPIHKINQIYRRLLELFVSS